jgi:hypothetical protein
MPFANPEDPDALAKRDFSAKERKAAAKSGAAMPDGSFPIESEEDLKNAIKAYGRSKDKDAAKAHIKKRAKALGLSKLIPEEWGTKEKKMDKIAAAEDLKKYVGEEAWDAKTAIEACQSLIYLLDKEKGETHDEAAGQVDDLVAAIQRIKSFIASEIQENDPEDDMGLTAGPTDLQKTGKAISGANLKHVQAIHDHAASLGADCSGMTKIAGPEDAESLAKIAGLEDELAKTATERDGLLAKIAELEKQPEDAKGALLDLSKILGVDKDAEDSMSKLSEADQSDPVALIKAIHASGGTVARR